MFASLSVIYSWTNLHVWRRLLCVQVVFSYSHTSLSSHDHIKKGNRLLSVDRIAWRCQRRSTVPLPPLQTLGFRKTTPTPWLSLFQLKVEGGWKRDCNWMNRRMNKVNERGNEQKKEWNNNPNNWKQINIKAWMRISLNWLISLTVWKLG
jgi:hypothetical protein